MFAALTNLNWLNRDNITAVQYAARTSSKSVVSILLGLHCDIEGLESDEAAGLVPPDILALRASRAPNYGNNSNHSLLKCIVTNHYVLTLILVINRPHFIYQWTLSSR